MASSSSTRQQLRTVTSQCDQWLLGVSVMCVKWQAVWQDADRGPYMLPFVLVGLWTAVLRKCKSLLVPGWVWAAGVRQEGLFGLLINCLFLKFATDCHFVFQVFVWDRLYISVCCFSPFSFGPCVNRHSDKYTNYVQSGWHIATLSCAVWGRHCPLLVEQMVRGSCSSLRGHASGSWFLHLCYIDP